MFFTQVNSIMNQGVDITLVIRKKDGQLIVSVMPKINGLKDEAQNHIVPLTVTGTPEELDIEFLPTIYKPLQKTVGLLSNMSQFEQQADKAAANSKAQKELENKMAKEGKEKKDKFDKYMKTAIDNESVKKYSESLASLQQAKGFATPEGLKSVEEKIKTIKIKLSQGSLFEEEIPEQPPQPQVSPANATPQSVQPMNGYTGQNGQQPVQPVYVQPQAQPITHNNYPYNGQLMAEVIPEPEPELTIAADYSAHREGEYDGYPDFPYSNNNMYNPQNM